MLILEMDLTAVSTMQSALIPYLNVFPELFVQMKEDLPSDPNKFNNLFGLFANDIRNACARRQIILKNEVLPFAPPIPRISPCSPKEINSGILEKNSSSYLYHESKANFWDEIAFLLSRYNEIKISEKCSDIQCVAGHASFLSVPLQNQYLEFQDEIERRIPGLSWKIKVYLNNTINPCQPSPTRAGVRGLCPSNWEFRSGRGLPHDRFWADSTKRIFITTSVGLQFNTNHKPLVYRLSAEIRRKRSRIIDFC